MSWDSMLTYAKYRKNESTTGIQRGGFKVDVGDLVFLRLKSQSGGCFKLFFYLILKIFV